ncbi:MAG TPA: IclR family transcriptional regulator [Polaromonas sp.]|nr:IclR family transcriptional regulator [Polaromonas sp.]
MRVVDKKISNLRSRGLDRAFEILDFFRSHRKPARPNEIASLIGAPRSSVYELVNLLLKHGVLEYFGDDGQVFLGRKLYFLGSAYAEHFDLMRECELSLSKIAEETRETAQLCMLDGNKYTVALMKEGIRPFRISSNVGEAIPIPWTASGRLLVAHLSDQEILDFIPEEDFKRPSGEWLKPEVFIQQVREASAAGYITFDSVVDNFTQCFAAPVYQAGSVCIATLCLVAPREDGQRNHKKYLSCLMDAANDLSQRLRMT